MLMALTAKKLLEDKNESHINFTGAAR